ncbi:MAG: hypothetical protein OEQ53_10595, partial [Saprospiraceae bacterium]|nr:hypothetical protein [Saprospiraceae bacterium]
FWKNGKQVNHLRENLPEPDPMPDEELPKYFVVRDSVRVILDNISFDPPAQESAIMPAEAASLP